ncbi:MAG: hypothetical protein ACTSO7_11585 [Candidatus Heimdallarchaeota archaeon]
MTEQKKEAIEGYFLTTKENLVFDVKGIAHPSDRIIAFVRYVPIEYGLEDKPKRKTHSKLYALADRYDFLQKNFPKYLFQDPQGRGLLQAVTKDCISKIHDPTKKLVEIIAKKEKDSLETLTSDFAEYLLEKSSIEQQFLGISGSILVNLHTKYSDLDFVVYGRENGLKIYEAMSNLFDSEPTFRRYNRDNLGELWVNRGQTKQLNLASFVIAEKNKLLQGKFEGVDFYIRLVPFPDEVQESYQGTKIGTVDVIEIEATIASDEFSIYCPAIYLLKDVTLLQSTKDLSDLPERIFSVRGRYCEIAKKDERVKVKGKLEKVSIEGKNDFYQLVLGTTPNEFFIKK